MGINVKSQTNRATAWKEGLNCVNLFLGKSFEMGLQVTEWGETKEIEPRVTFAIKDNQYSFTVAGLESLLTK